MHNESFCVWLKFKFYTVIISYCYNVNQHFSKNYLVHFIIMCRTQRKDDAT